MLLSSKGFIIIIIIIIVVVVNTFTFTFTFSHLADTFIQSDLQLGVHKAINLEEANRGSANNTKSQALFK